MPRSPSFGPSSSGTPFDDPQPGALVAKEVAGDNSAPLSITEISARLKRSVEERFGFVRLRGELSGVKRPGSGHLYCCLKDEGARIDGVMWKGAAARLGFAVEDGVEVIATGKLTTYPGRSTYQIVIERMEIAGEGALLALLARTRARLEAEGLFDPARKRPIPFLPRTIGVITSPTGAVIRDILHRLAARFPSHVLVWPVLVQGSEAGAQVAAALRGFGAMAADRRPDVIIVARGGGSIEDLWAFNEEAVVRAIAACPVPVISAVGHETDTTLADFAADLRAPTPTAAAELAVPVREHLIGAVGELALRQRRAAARPLALGRERLEARVRRLPAREALLARPAQRLDEAGERLRRGLRERIAVAARVLQRDAARLSVPLLQARLGRSRDRVAGVRLGPAVLAGRVAGERARLEALARLVGSLNPDNILQRGYVRVTGVRGRTLVSRAAAAAERALDLHFRDGVMTVAPGETVRPSRRAAPIAEQGKLL